MISTLPYLAVAARAVLVCAAIFFTADAAAEPLRIVTRNVEPFSFEENGRWTGFSIELWDAIAKEAGYQYEMRGVENVPQMMDALVAKQADAGVAALSITSEREKLIDFSHPFFESGLQILTRDTGRNTTSGWSILRAFLDAGLLKILGILLAAVLIVSVLVWIFERPVNEPMFPGKAASGLWESFWWTIGTLLVGGVDNKGPIGIGGRIIGIAWMIASIVAVAYLTASVTTVMTVNTLAGDISSPADLPGRAVATVAGSTAESWLRARGVEVSGAANLQAACAALNAGKVEAVVFDAPMLRYYASRFGAGKLKLAGAVFENQDYGIGLQPGSPLRKPINEALLALKERGFIEALQKKWFGSGE